MGHDSVIAGVTQTATELDQDILAINMLSITNLSTGQSQFCVDMTNKGNDS